MAIERRFLPTATLRIKRSGEGTKQKASIVGHASVFDQRTFIPGPMGGFFETVRKGAFTRAIKEKQDVAGLFNHDRNFVLGRTSAGTLRLKEDKQGLLSQIDTPDTQTIRDLVVSPIERGDIQGMSFSFLVRDGERKVIHDDPDMRIIERGGERLTFKREGGKIVTERELIDLDLLDVSPVTFPAYEGTDVAARSREIGSEIASKEIHEERQLFEARATTETPGAATPIRDEMRCWLDSQKA